ncbi:ATP-binding protein [Zooshikella ganghwensis]|uniref:histidine kinase n=1 Tax=Zooshikella ganghwensis TaxID=202772 RepID=A0A4P9VKM4_9GAMM|nr:ATP-binding protein [Zooshikella ganghwensis]RDH42847.1 HAMP domain-containing protein [Zooshikella ganghwensis]
MSLFPRKIASQLILLMLFALVAAQFISTVVIGQRQFKKINQNFINEFEYRLNQLNQLIPTLDNQQRQLVLNAASTGIINFSLANKPIINKTVGKWQPIFQHAPKTLYVWHQEPCYFHAGLLCDPDVLDFSDNIKKNMSWPVINEEIFTNSKVTHAASFQITDNQWLNAALLPPPRLSALSTNRTITFLVICGLIMIAVVTAITHHITSPLRLLSEYAHRFGRGESLPPLPPQGTIELQETIKAFNEMYTRIQRFTNDRTQLLAALSHDLRTPITSLALRLEFLPDCEDKDRMLLTLKEMQHMVETTLTHVRVLADTEQFQSVDLASLISSVAIDLIDLGMPIKMHLNKSITAKCKPIALRRAVRNLLENAVRYGQQAHVSLFETEHSIKISVKDQGPGIPQEKLNEVLKPFFRLESSRNSNSGGIGLGLTITKDIIQNHGGQLILNNLSPRGLEVVIKLPK